MPNTVSEPLLILWGVHNLNDFNPHSQPRGSAVVMPRPFSFVNTSCVRRLLLAQDTLNCFQLLPTICQKVLLSSEQDVLEMVVLVLYYYWLISASYISGVYVHMQ